MSAALAAPRPEAAAAGAPMLSVSGVTMRFGTAADGVTAVDDVSFDIRPGEFVSVIGPSGCGKSTLFNIIAGLQRHQRPGERGGYPGAKPAPSCWHGVPGGVLLPLADRHRQRLLPARAGRGGPAGTGTNRRATSSTWSGCAGSSAVAVGAVGRHAAARLHRRHPGRRRGCC